MTASARAAGRPGAHASRGGGRVPVTWPPALPTGHDDIELPTRQGFSKERKVSLLSVELSRERIRDHDRLVEHLGVVARARATRRARRDARVRALRVRRLLLSR